MPLHPKRVGDPALEALMRRLVLGRVLSVMDPSQQWSLPPPAKKLEKSEDVLYTAVGRALSCWEVMEGQLSMCFALFLAPIEMPLAAKRSYGAAVSFGARQDMLRYAAEAYFSEHPDSPGQEAFAGVLNEAAKASPRRNDIAHGVVQPVWPDERRENRGYLLVPSYYTSKRRGLSHEATYAFSTVEIDRFAQQFTELWKAVIDVFVEMDGHHRAKRKRAQLGLKELQRRIR